MNQRPWTCTLLRDTCFFYLKDGQMENDENYPERFETILDSWFSDSNFQVYQIT